MLCDFLSVLSVCVLICLTVCLLVSFVFCFFFFLVFLQIAVLKKHHRAAHAGHYYECLVKFKGVAYNKVLFPCGLHETA